MIPDSGMYPTSADFFPLSWLLLLLFLKMLLDSPLGLTVHQSTGDLYIADTNNNQIVLVKYGSTDAFRIAGQTWFDGFDGDGGPATNALFNTTIGLALDASGNLYVADTYNNVVRRMFLSSSSSSSSSPSASSTTNSANDGTTTTTTDGTSNSNSVNYVGGGIGAVLFVVSLIFILRALSQAYNNRRPRGVVVAVEMEAGVAQAQGHGNVSSQEVGGSGPVRPNHAATAVRQGMHHADAVYAPVPGILYTSGSGGGVTVHTAGDHRIIAMATATVTANVSGSGGGVPLAGDCVSTAQGVTRQQGMGGGPVPRLIPLNRVDRDGLPIISIQPPVLTNTNGHTQTRVSSNHGRRDVPVAVAVPLYGRSLH